MATRKEKGSFTRFIPGWVIAALGLKTDNVAEKTAGHGVDVDGLLIKDGGAGLKTDTTTLIDPNDTTKKASFGVAGITPGQTRTITVPNANCEIGKHRAVHFFQSTEQTGNGSPQNIAHGFGVAPTVWWITPSLNKDGADCAFTKGAADGTNCPVTATTGAKYYVQAMLLG